VDRVGVLDYLSEGVPPKAPARLELHKSRGLVGRTRPTQASELGVKPYSYDMDGIIGYAHRHQPIHRYPGTCS
jgi:hypothetical protein